VGDRGGRPVVHVANRAFASMFDVPLGDLLGMGLEDLASRLTGRSAAGVRAAELLRGSAEGGSPITVAADDPAANVFLLRVTALQDETGSSIGRLLVCRDLTEQRRSERQLEEQAERLEAGRVELAETYGGLHEAHKELHRRNEELDQLNAELRRLDKMKSDLLGNVSHELQTPLVSVRGYTEMILRERLGPINEEQRKGLERSLASVDRMIAMIEGLLEVGRAEPARSEPGRGAADSPALESQVGRRSHGRRTRFPLRRVVEEAWELLREAAAENRLEISIDTGPREPELEADRDEVLQVLSNLLSNAIKHSPAGRRIEVLAVGREPGRIELHVRDEGPGIPPEVRERVFERRFQVRRPGEPAPAGSGLGLAIVRDIVTRHGGTVRAAANPAGRGADIVVTLPAAAATPIVDETPSDRATSSDRDTGPPRPPGGQTPRPRLRIIRKQRGDARSR
jgi:signal transduction histidine kinase